MSDEMLKLADKVEQEATTAGSMSHNEMMRVAAILRAAASAEPVAWWCVNYPGGGGALTPFEDVVSHWRSQGLDVVPLYTHPAPDAEIVAALEELERANEALAASRPQAVYDAMIAGRQEDQLLALDRARARARAILAKAKGGSQPSSALEPFIRAAKIIAKRPQDYKDRIAMIGGLADASDLTKRHFAALLEAFGNE